MILLRHPFCSREGSDLVVILHVRNVCDKGIWPKPAMKVTFCLPLEDSNRNPPVKTCMFYQLSWRGLHHTDLMSAGLLSCPPPSFRRKATPFYPYDCLPRSTPNLGIRQDSSFQSLRPFPFSGGTSKRHQSISVLNKGTIVILSGAGRLVSY